MFTLTPEGRRVWDGDRGGIARAELVVHLVRIGDRAVTSWKRLAGVPGPTVIYKDGFVGRPASMQLAKLLKAHRATPGYCREPGVFEILTSMPGIVLGL